MSGNDKYVIWYSEERIYQNIRNILRNIFLQIKE